MALFPRGEPTFVPAPGRSLMVARISGEITLYDVADNKLQEVVPQWIIDTGEREREWVLGESLLISCGQLIGAHTHMSVFGRENR